MAGGGVLRNAFVQRFCDALAIAGTLQFALIGRAADERNFSKNRRHGSSGQDDVRSLLYSAVAHALTLRGQRTMHGLLHCDGKAARLLHLFANIDVRPVDVFR